MVVFYNINILHAYISYTTKRKLLGLRPCESLNCMWSKLISYVLQVTRSNPILIIIKSVENRPIMDGYFHMMHFSLTNHT